MRPTPAFFLSACFLATGCGSLPSGEHAGHQAAPADGRQAVEFPEPMRTHTLANMRDHLLALQEIQQALADGAHEMAGRISERRLGMSSLQAHGAHDVAKFMPEDMQAIGTEMHRSASRFAVEASNAGATADTRKALGALAAVTRQCVACHATYRMK